MVNKTIFVNENNEMEIYSIEQFLNVENETILKIDNKFYIAKGKVIDLDKKIEIVMVQPK